LSSTNYIIYFVLTEFGLDLFVEKGRNIHNFRG
jgi:hypothetical protein